MSGIVTVDVSAAVHARAGLGRYAATLADALERERPGAVRLFANGGARANRNALLPNVPTRSVRLGYKPWRMAVWAGQLGRIGFDGLLGETDIFHATEHLLMPLRSIPTVMTVHDLIFEVFPEHHKKLNRWYLHRAMPLYVRRADHIIAVSETTKQDLMRLYGTPADKITVIYEAAALHFRPQAADRIADVKARYSLPERYLITVGTIEPRKNLARLVEALSSLRRDDPDVRLVVVGGNGWLIQGFFEAIERFGQQRAVIRPGFVPDDDLPAMMCGAMGTVIPSLYEGFGLPVLEAMACGVPVACSNNSSVAEIARDAAIPFAPTSIEALVDALRRLVSDDRLRDELRQKGLKRSADFSWERAAKETWMVYDQVLNR